MYMKAFTRVFSIVAFMTLIPSGLFASEIVVRPFLIDAQVEARETYTDVITLKNNYPTRKAILFATVNEISVDAVGEIKEFVSPVMTDRTNTVTSWVEITRGRIEVKPGELLEVPITVRVHPQAEPGEYHVFLGMVEASKRAVAEEIALSGEADGVILKVTVSDDRKDSMRIAGFLIDRFVTGKSSRVIDIQVENAGDLESKPSGEIIFYNSRGVEVSTTAINTEGLVIAPGETKTIQAEVPLENTLGRFKANVALEYGANQRASLYDTTYFYMIPMHFLLVGLVGIVVVSLLITLLFRRVLATREYGYDETGEDVVMYVKDGHVPNPKDHDIDLKNKAN